MLYKKQAKNILTGRRAEQAAIHYCRSKLGWTVVSKNWKRRGGEIDLVCWDQKELIMVEVKYRSTVSFGSAPTQLKPQKLQRIISTAERFCYEKGLFLPWRIDFIAIQRLNKHFVLRHYRNIDTGYLQDANN